MTTPKLLQEHPIQFQFQQAHTVSYCAKVPGLGSPNFGKSDCDEMVNHTFQKGDVVQGTCEGFINDTLPYQARIILPNTNKIIIIQQPATMLRAIKGSCQRKETPTPKEFSLQQIPIWLWAMLAFLVWQIFKEDLKKIMD